MSYVTGRIWAAAAIVVFLVGLVATGSLGASASSSPKAGGTYRVAFEQSFGFTDGFDPTGEYYTYSLAIESNLMIRTLVGYDHVAGPGGQRARPRPRHHRPEADGRRHDLHLPHQATA